GDGAGDAVADVERLRVARHRQAVRPGARGQEADLLHGGRVDNGDAITALVRHVEDGAVGRQTDVDRQAVHVDPAGDLHLDRVDFHHDPAVLGAGQQVAAIGGKIEVVDARPGDVDALEQPPRMRVPEVQPVEALHGHD